MVLNDVDRDVLFPGPVGESLCEVGRLWDVRVGLVFEAADFWAGNEVLLASFGKVGAVVGDDGGGDDGGDGRVVDVVVVDVIVKEDVDAANDVGACAVEVLRADVTLV